MQHFDTSSLCLQPAASRKLFSVRRNRVERPAAPSPHAAGQSPPAAPSQPAAGQPLHNHANGVKPGAQDDAAQRAPFQPTRAWPPSANSNPRPSQQPPAMSEAARLYGEALQRPPVPARKQPTHVQRGPARSARPAAGRTPQPQPPQRRPPRASTAPSAFVDLDSSSSNASSTEVHGGAAGDAQHDAQSAQGLQAAEAQHANSQASPTNSRSLAAHRRAPPPTGPIFRPTPPAPKYHRRQPAAGSSIAAKAAAAATDSAAPGPEASSVAAPAAQASADRADQPDAAYASGPVACLAFWSLLKPSCVVRIIPNRQKRCIGFKRWRCY